MNPPLRGTAKFDIGHLSPRALSYNDVSNRAQRKSRPMLSCEANSFAMIGNADWLKVYGLSANKISLQQILPGSGFKHVNKFDSVVGKDVCSKYASGMFLQYPRRDGKIYNIVGGREKVQQYMQQLNAAIKVYKKRLDWMTSGTRRFFGVIQERVVTIVIDIHTSDEKRFDLFKSALEDLLNDQISKIHAFNLIRSAQDAISFKECPVEVTNASINEAIQWVNDLDRYTLNTNTCVVEAVEQAFQHRSSKYGVYLFTENGSTDRARQLLRTKVESKRDTNVPFHTVAYNTTDKDTIEFLKMLATCTQRGRFHAYSITESSVNEMTGETTFFGGTPSGAGTSDEVMMIWSELEAAKDTLSQLEEIHKWQTGAQNESPPPKPPVEKTHATTLHKPPNGQYMNSRQWLEQNGMDARSLDFYVFLSSVAFRHCDGVVKTTQEQRSPRKSGKKEIKSKDALINAKYCENFVHVLWRDGRVRHVQVTGKMFREYENRMNTMLHALQLRISWLCQGSRELFGTICEDSVYILIDTSASMESRIAMVKDKLFQLMQEQLRHKVAFNIVAYDSSARPWRDVVMNVTESNLREAWEWIKNLEVGGSTNTLEALKLALGDRKTEAVYLLSDGRPDHKPKQIYAQACLHPRIPIHTISFNCHEQEANEFLRELADISGGRFHVYYDTRAPNLANGPKGFMSEDVSLLRQEAERGKQALRLVAKLRAECAALEFGPLIGASSETTSQRGTPRTPAATPRKRRSVIDPEKELSQFEQQKLESVRKTVSQIQRYDLKESEPGASSRGSTSGKPEEDPFILEETRKMFEDQKLRRDQALQKAIDQLEQIDTARSKSSARGRRSQSSDSDLRTWMKANSLVAKRLTIIDALSSTLVTQTPKFVPSIDKVVLSRVFDDILPISYATSGGKNEIHLVNPSAVDLKLYEQKLSDLLQRYNKKLDSTVWKSLPEEERAKYSNMPPNWETDRADIWESLKRCHWPVPKEHVQCVVDEIELGKKFLQQSIDLRLSHQTSLTDKSKAHNQSNRSLTRAKTARGTSKIKQENRQEPRKLNRRPLTARDMNIRSKSHNSRGRNKENQNKRVTDSKVELTEDEVRLINLYRSKTEEKKQLMSESMRPKSARNPKRSASAQSVDRRSDQQKTALQPVQIPKTETDESSTIATEKSQKESYSYSESSEQRTSTPAEIIQPPKTEEEDGVRRVETRDEQPKATLKNTSPPTKIPVPTPQQDSAAESSSASGSDSDFFC